MLGARKKAVPQDGYCRRGEGMALSPFRIGT